MIKGISIIYIHKNQEGLDAFNRPIYTEKEEVIENVLIAPTTTNDIVTSQDLTGKKAVYTLAIPKGDEHKWENAKVRFFGEEWQVVGMPLEGIEENLPLSWNKKVTVVRYE